MGTFTLVFEVDDYSCISLLFTFDFAPFSKVDLYPCQRIFFYVESSSMK